MANKVITVDNATFQKIADGDLHAQIIIGDSDLCTGRLTLKQSSGERRTVEVTLVVKSRVKDLHYELAEELGHQDAATLVAALIQSGDIQTGQENCIVFKWA